MKSISYFEFDRKKFMKQLRSRFSTYLIMCDLFRTGNLKSAEQAYKRIANLVNETLKNKLVFDNNNIFILITNLDLHHRFITDFANSIKNTKDISALKDRQIAFFRFLTELEKFVTDNFTNPKATELPE